MNKNSPPNRNPFFKAFIKLVSEKVPCINASTTYPSTFESCTKNGETTFPPVNRSRTDRERTYRHNGIDGWKIQGYAMDGSVLLATDVYKQLDLRCLQELNSILGESRPTIGEAYRVRRSNGSMDYFIFQGVNPASDKLMMVKPAGCIVKVTTAELSRENCHPSRSSSLATSH